MKNFEIIARVRLAEIVATRDLRNSWEEIRPLLETGVEIARRQGDAFWEAYYLMRLGQYYVSLNDFTTGEIRLVHSLDIIEQLKARTKTLESKQPINIQEWGWLEAEAWMARARAALGQGETERALRYAEKAVAVAGSYGKGWERRARLVMAWVLRAMDRKEEALTLISEALPGIRLQGWKSVEQEALYLEGLLLMESGHQEEAETSIRQALQMAQELKLREEEVKCLLSLGQVLLALGQCDEARDVLTQAWQLSQERNYVDHFQRAEELLRGG